VYILSAQNIPPVLPNTGAGEVFAVVSMVTVAIAAVVVLSTVARQVAKKHYNA
jgi:hypothetical protein